MEGGHGLDLVYADDFHHEVRVLLTGERDGYYADYAGRPERIVKAIREGFIYQGQPSVYPGAPRGTATGEAAWQFLFGLQNHDQVGNRALGERLNQVVDPGRYAAATALLLLAPETPALFMGQEFAASTPFLYFTDHEPGLGRLVTEGRRREFAGSAPSRTQRGGNGFPTRRRRRPSGAACSTWGSGRATAERTGCIATSSPCAGWTPFSGARTARRCGRARCAGGSSPSTAGTIASTGSCSSTSAAPRTWTWTPSR